MWVVFRYDDDNHVVETIGPFSTEEEGNAWADAHADGPISDYGFAEKMRAV